MKLIMAKQTFLNLPEEKRIKIFNSLKKEFSRVALKDALVSNIVKDAEIPRGSFYQYFEDKEDLLSFLLRDLEKAFWNAIKLHLQAHDGDLSAALLSVFDSWFLCRSAPDLSASRCLLLLRKNPSLDWQRIIFPGQVPGLPGRIQAWLSPPASLSDSACMETAHMLAVVFFTATCKQCLFRPEDTPLCRRELLMALRLIFRAVSIPSSAAI